MRSPVARTLFTIASFLPLVGVLGLTGWILASGAREHFGSQDDVVALALTVVAGATAIALVQIALGIAVALHVTRRPDLSGAERAGWAIACLFVGSFALPLFSFLVLPGAAAAEAPAPTPWPGR